MAKNKESVSDGDQVSKEAAAVPATASPDEQLSAAIQRQLGLGQKIADDVVRRTSTERKAKAMEVLRRNGLASQLRDAIGPPSKPTDETQQRDQRKA